MWLASVNGMWVKVTMWHFALSLQRHQTFLCTLVPFSYEKNMSQRDTALSAWVPEQTYEKQAWTQPTAWNRVQPTCSLNQSLPTQLSLGQLNSNQWANFLRMRINTCGLKPPGLGRVCYTALLLWLLSNTHTNSSVAGHVAASLCYMYLAVKYRHVTNFLPKKLKAEMLDITFRSGQDHEYASSSRFPMARTQIWKSLSFDNPYDENSLSNNGTMTWKYSGSLDDHQPRLLPVELLDGRRVSSTVFKPQFIEHCCYSHCFTLINEVGRHCLLWEVLRCYS